MSLTGSFVRARARAAGRCCRRLRSSRGEWACPCGCARRITLRTSLARGNEEHLVARRNHRIRLRAMIGLSRPKIAATRVSTLGMWSRDLVQLVSDQRTTVEGAHRDQPDPTTGELQHLQRLWKVDQLREIVADDLLWADDVVDREILGRKELRDASHSRRNARVRSAWERRIASRRCLHATRLVSSLWVTASSMSVSFDARLSSTTGVPACPVTVRRSRRSWNCAGGQAVGVDDGDVVRLRHQRLRPPTEPTAPAPRIRIFMFGKILILQRVRARAALTGPSLSETRSRSTSSTRRRARRREPR